MKNKKTILIAFGSIALVIVLFVGSYFIREKQFKALLDETAIMNNEETGIDYAEYGTKVENETVDDILADYITADDVIADDEVVDEIGNVSELYVEPSAKLEDIYEEALEAVRPGSKVVYEQTETQTVSNNQNPQEPSTPTQAIDNNSNTQKPKKPSENSKKTIENKKAALLAGIEELKVIYPGYDEEWDIVAQEFYTDEEIRTQNTLDQLCVLDMYAEQRLNVLISESLLEKWGINNTMFHGITPQTISDVKIKESTFRPLPEPKDVINTDSDARYEITFNQGLNGFFAAQPENVTLFVDLKKIDGYWKIAMWATSP